jgi:hypothetical protein
LGAYGTSPITISKVSQKYYYGTRVKAGYVDNLQLINYSLSPFLAFRLQEARGGKEVKPVAQADRIKEGVYKILLLLKGEYPLTAFPPPVLFEKRTQNFILFFERPT